MAWSTKGAIIGDLHGLQVNRHYPHHSPFICSFWEQDLSILQDFLRIYGFEGAAPKEGEDVTRTSESFWPVLTLSIDGKSDFWRRHYYK